MEAFTSARGEVSLIRDTRLRRYLTDIAHVDIYWYIGSRLHAAPLPLPALKEPLKGESIVQWRYHFNTGKINLLSVYLTVFFSYIYMRIKSLM